MLINLQHDCENLWGFNPNSVGHCQSFKIKRSQRDCKRDFKGHPCNARFTAALVKVLFDQVWIRY